MSGSSDARQQPQQQTRSTAIVTKADEFAKLLKTYEGRIVRTLPKHLPADKFLQTALNEIRRVPQLGECDPKTLIGGIMTAGQLGLEIGGLLGQFYLIPFRNTERGVTEATAIVGYKGLIALAYRSDRIVGVIARTVFQGDKFHLSFGTSEHLEHEPAFQSRDTLYWYALCHIKGAQLPMFDVMDRTDVGAIRARSKAKDKGPWVSDFDAMAKKTVLRRLLKTMPISTTLSSAVMLDELADAGVDQNLGSVIDGEFSEIVTQAKRESESNDKKPETATTSSEEPVLTYAEVADALNKAKDGDAFNLALDMIRSVPSPDQQKELQALAEARKQELAK
jgi:recombination protein RecT